VTNKAPFNNVQVREAMAYAVPYQQIIDNVYDGTAVRKSSGPLLTDWPGYDGAGLTNYTYNPTMAKSLLASAGFPNGVSFTLTVDSGAPDDVEAATQIQSYAAAAGFTVTINQLPSADFQTGVQQDTFQAYLFDNYAGTLTPSYELGVWTSPTGSNNEADWMDPTFYTDLAAALAVPNQLSATAGRLYEAAEQEMISQSPIIFIANIQEGVGLSKSLAGMAWRSDNNVDYYNLHWAKS
jgi:peptide/nickel transport system substrate-binding protein